MEKPKSGVIIYFRNDDKILVDSIEVNKTDLLKYLVNLASDKPNKFICCHDKNSSYEKFVQNSIFITQFKLQMPNMNLTNVEFVY